MGCVNQIVILTGELGMGLLPDNEHDVRRDAVRTLGRKS